MVETLLPTAEGIEVMAWAVRFPENGTRPASGAAEQLSHIVRPGEISDVFRLPGWTPGAKAISDDGLVAEERVLHPALTMVPGRLLPLAPAELLGVVA